jgi:hypothetical protein
MEDRKMPTEHQLQMHVSTDAPPTVSTRRVSSEVEGALDSDYAPYHEKPFTVTGVAVKGKPGNKTPEEHHHNLHVTVNTKEDVPTHHVAHSVREYMTPARGEFLINEDRNRITHYNTTG